VRVSFFINRAQGEPEYSVACGLSSSMEGVLCDGFTLFAISGALPRAVGFEPFRLSTYFAICLTIFYRSGVLFSPRMGLKE
jgi:hypothetical protein